MNSFKKNIPDDHIRKIIHVDMDAFYASVEQRDNPGLKGKPVVVGGSPSGRGVVAAASYEARKYGIHSAMPSARAVTLCPDAIFIKPRFDVYRAVSSQIREIFYLFTDKIEPLSLDEAYLDVTENFVNSPSATKIAEKIKLLIKQETGLTASAGVSFNKFLAKIASDADKPDGLFIITPEEAHEFLENLEVKKFHGVGEVTAGKMETLGITNGKDLKKWDEADLVKHFGKPGHHFYRIVRGIDKRKVKPDRLRKSVGKERTFPDDISDLPWMKTFIEELSDQVSTSLKKKKAAGKTVTLKVRYDDFETITRSSTVHNYINSAEDISSIALSLLDETEAGFRKVRLIGVTVSTLNLKERAYGKQLEIKFQ